MATRMAFYEGPGATILLKKLRTFAWFYSLDGAELRSRCGG